MVLNIYFNISDYVFYILWVDGGANMDIAIIDDEQVFLEIFKSDVIKICNDNDIECYIDTFNSARNIMEIYKNYHLIFLDIDMPGTDGITALREINKIYNPKEFPYIAFVTSKENLIYEALKEFPYTFIRKKDINGLLENCICNIYEKTNPKKQKYTIKCGRNLVNVFIKDIIYIDKIKNYVWFHTVNGTYKERASIEEKFADLMSQNFVRTHIGCLVNLDYIFEVTPNSVLLDNGESVVLSRKYYNEVNNRYYESLVVDDD